jgi:hypothetical protein
LWLEVGRLQEEHKYPRHTCSVGEQILLGSATEVPPLHAHAAFAEALPQQDTALLTGAHKNACFCLNLIYYLQQRV